MASTVKWSDINDDDLNSEELQGFVSTRGDTKTTSTYAETCEGSIKIITRSKVHRRVARFSHTQEKVLETLRKTTSPSHIQPVSICDKVYIEVPRHLRKIEDDTDSFDTSNKDVPGGLPVLRRDTVKEKFQQILLYATGSHPSENIEQVIKRTEERDETDPSYVKYVAPRVRMTQKDDSTVRVTNLSEETKEKDLEDLFGRIGKISRIYLAKDKETKYSKGFAFITYDDRRSAEKAIRTLDRHGYDSLLLKVEWAKPSTKNRE